MNYQNQSDDAPRSGRTTRMIERAVDELQLGCPGIQVVCMTYENAVCHILPMVEQELLRRGEPFKRTRRFELQLTDHDQLVRVVAAHEHTVGRTPGLSEWVDHAAWAYLPKD